MVKVFQVRAMTRIRLFVEQVNPTVIGIRRFISRDAFEARLDDLFKRRGRRVCDRFTKIQTPKKKKLLHVAQFQRLTLKCSWISNVSRLVRPHCSGGRVEDPAYAPVPVSARFVLLGTFQKSCLKGWRLGLSVGTSKHLPRRGFNGQTCSAVKMGELAGSFQSWSKVFFLKGRAKVQGFMIHDGFSENVCKRKNWNSCFTRPCAVVGLLLRRAHLSKVAFRRNKDVWIVQRSGPQQASPGKQPQLSGSRRRPLSPPLSVNICTWRPLRTL